jgi:hypothetical protein
LARRAGTIRRGDAVASWLYGVARRIAVRARRDLARRRELERRRLERTARSEPASAPPAEPWPELYEEIDRLPESFRAAVVLCDLEGHSYEQAAGLLGCPVGTLQSRLSRGRERLRGRLERRGITPAVVGIGSGANLAVHPTALSPPLTATIARAAVGIIAGRTIAGAAPAAVAALAGAEVRRQVMNRALTTLMMLLVAGLMTTAAIVMAAGGRSDDPRHQPPAVAKRPDAGPIHVRVVDLEGKGAAGITVELRGGDQPRSFATDADGHTAIPRGLVGEEGFLIARRGSEAFTWGATNDPRPNRPAGTIDDPIVMRILPVDHRVEGSIVDQEGKPLVGIRVRVFSLNHPVNGSLGFEPIALEEFFTPTATDQAGRFAMRLPREAHTLLRGSHPRYVGPWIGAPPEARVLETTTLEPAGGIVGRVIDAVTGRPVAGAVLGAGLVEHHARFLSGGGDTTSDDQGRFLLGGLEPGVYNVMLRKVPGRAHATARAVECIRVRAGSDIPADLAVIEGHPLRGVVVDRNTGEPVPGTQVGCYGPARPPSAPEVQVQKSDDQGRFTFHVPPGEQVVYCMSGYGNSRLDHRTVLVPEREEIDPVRLLMTARGPRTPAAPAFMKKVDAPQPVPPAEAGAPGVPKKAVLPRDGLAAVKAKGRAAVVPVPAQKVRTITGHVRDLHGRPLSGVHIDIPPDIGGLPAALHKPSLFVTDRDGLFLFLDLPRQPLKVRLSRAGYRFQMVDLSADRDEVEWTFGLIPDPGIRNEPVPVHDEPMPPDLRDRLMFVDLDPWGTDYLADGPDQGGNDLNRLPRGIHQLGETYFRIGEKMVHLKGGMRTELPQSVKEIKVQARGAVLHFLHSTGGGLDDGKLVGAYVIHYADGSVEQVPLVYSRDITNWWHRDPGRKITQAKPAWTGVNDAVERHTRPGLKVRLFDLTWTNPHPDKEITSLDVLSAGKECDPFLVAVTLYRDK